MFGKDAHQRATSGPDHRHHNTHARTDQDLESRLLAQAGDIVARLDAAGKAVDGVRHVALCELFSRLVHHLHHAGSTLLRSSLLQLCVQVLGGRLLLLRQGRRARTHGTRPRGAHRRGPMLAPEGGPRDCTPPRLPGERTGPYGAGEFLHGDLPDIIFIQVQLNRVPLPVSRRLQQHNEAMARVPQDHHALSPRILPLLGCQEASRNISQNLLHLFMGMQIADATFQPGKRALNDESITCV